jgi:hypothetical protein
VAQTLGGMAEELPRSAQCRGPREIGAWAAVACKDPPPFDNAWPCKQGCGVELWAPVASFNPRGSIRAP